VGGIAEVPSPSKESVQKEYDRIYGELIQRTGDENLYDIRRELRETMDRCVGVFRTGPELQEGLDAVLNLKERYRSAPVKDKSHIFNTDLTSALEIENLLDLAEVSIRGALAREESRGGHARRDFTTRDDDNWLKHTIARWTPKQPELSYSSVAINTWKPVERKY
jgi:succinate dehydrogenase / fumarate reductase flavoprotein subunit